MTGKEEHLLAEIERIKKGGAEKYHERNRQQKKLFARDRLKLLLDDGKIEFEDGMFAECQNPELPADGVITGVGRIHGRPVAFSASDSTVKAGSMGEKSVQKNLRIQEMAMQMRIPMFYLIDSAGARITDQIRLFPGRNHGGRTFLHPRQLYLVVESAPAVVAPGEEANLVGDARTRRVDEIEHGNAHLHRHLLDTQIFLHRLLARRSSFYRGVGGAEGNGTAMNAAHTGDDAIGGQLRVLALGEHAIFKLDLAIVEQEREPVSRK